MKPDYSALARKWDAAHPQTFKFTSMADVRAANKQIGGHWFDRSTMRFFNTRIVSKLLTRGPSEKHPGGWQCFITSERMDDDHPIGYTIRLVQPNGEIDTLGEFQGYRTAEDAMYAIKYGGIG